MAVTTVVNTVWIVCHGNKEILDCREHGNDSLFDAFPEVDPELPEAVAVIPKINECRDQRSDCRNNQDDRVCQHDRVQGPEHRSKGVPMTEVMVPTAEMTLPMTTRSGPIAAAISATFDDDLLYRFRDAAPDLRE